MMGCIFIIIDSLHYSGNRTTSNVCPP